MLYNFAQFIRLDVFVSLQNTWDFEVARGRLKDEITVWQRAELLKALMKMSELL